MLRIHWLLTAVKAEELSVIHAELLDWSWRFFWRWTKESGSNKNKHLSDWTMWKWLGWATWKWLICLQPTREREMSCTEMSCTNADCDSQGDEIPIALPSEDLGSLQSVRGWGFMVDLTLCWEELRRIEFDWFSRFSRWLYRDELYKRWLRFSGGWDTYRFTFWGPGVSPECSWMRLYGGSDAVLGRVEADWVWLILQVHGERLFFFACERH
jgi:hypothetical protein